MDHSACEKISLISMPTSISAPNSTPRATPGFEGGSYFLNDFAQSGIAREPEKPRLGDVVTFVSAEGPCAALVIEARGH